MVSMDSFDLKMLVALQEDGRLTNQQLADAVGLSASQCSRRRMRLEEEGVISGYHADLASERLGFNVIAFVHITLATHSPDNAQHFRDLVQRRETILASILEQGKLTDELKGRIEATLDKSELEDLYLPYRPKRRTKATIAREKGLEPLALYLMAQEAGEQPLAVLAAGGIAR